MQQNPALQRSEGKVSLSLKLQDGKTALDKLYQQGCCKLRFPRTREQADLEAVLINTAGGLTDDDAIDTEFTWHANTRATITTQAAERIYRSRRNYALIETRLQVSKDATAYWLPQETILFNGARFKRSTKIDLDKTATFIGVESLVFGRAAMGETMITGSVKDQLSIRIDGKPVFTDALELCDDLHGNIQSHLNKPAIANGASCIATLIYVHPKAQKALDDIRALLKEKTVTGGATRVGPLIVMRILAKKSTALRTTVKQLICRLTEKENSIPRVWDC